jgi:dihydrofolate reductase
MAKLVLAMFTSLDGYIEGPGGAFIPPAWSGDMEAHWSGYGLARAAHLIYGRKNFEFNRGFWEAAAGDPNGPSHTDTMNSLPKSVVSTTLTGDPGWNGAVIAGDLAGAIGRLKETAPGDIFAFGGAGVAGSLVKLDLIDEYRILIMPDLFGGGTRLFEPGGPRLGLTLVEHRALDTGAVIVHYRRDR